MRKEVLRTFNLSKFFIKSKVVDNVSINLFEGEVLGIWGLKSSGKTSLGNILCGELQPDSGKIYFQEQEVSLLNRKIAKQLGIYYINEALNLVPNLSIAWNLYAIQSPVGALQNAPRWFINQKAINRQTIRELDAWDMSFDPNTKVAELTYTQQKMLEIVMAVIHGAKIIVLDDICRSCPDQDYGIFAALITSLRSRNISVIYTSIRLDFVLSICDRLILLNNGKKIASFHKDEFCENRIISIMSKDLSIKPLQVRQHSTNKCVLEANIPFNGNNLGFSLHKGEVLGIVDVEGAVYSHLLACLMGEKRLDKECICIEGAPAALNSVKDSLNKGIGVIMGDFMKYGLFRNMTVERNINFLILNKLRNFLGLVSSRKTKFSFRENAEFTDMGKDDALSGIEDLSVEQQIKVLFTRYYLMRPKVLILAFPSLNLDLFNCDVLYNLIEQFSSKGIAILLFSCDPGEIRAVCDRIYLAQGNTMGVELTSNDIQDDSMFALLQSRTHSN